MLKAYKLAWGVGVAFAIGFSASRLGIAVPAPPALIGALLVTAMTLGYVGTDRYLIKRSASCRDMCGGPDGVVRRERSDNSDANRGGSL